MNVDEGGLGRFLTRRNCPPLSSKPVIKHVPKLALLCSGLAQTGFTAKSVKLELEEQKFSVCDLLIRWEQWDGILKYL